MNIFKKIFGINTNELDSSKPNWELKSEELAFIFNVLKQSSDNLNKGIKQFMLAEAEVLNSGVIEKDGIIWPNMN